MDSTAAPRLSAVALGKARNVDELQPHRGGDEDFDLISGWARSLSVSPRLYPTSYSSLHSGHGDSVFGGGYKGLGEHSPLLGPRRSGEALLLSVGNGLSPLLGPTLGGTDMTSMGYDYSYNGNGGSYRTSLHLSPPSNPVGTSNHSFSNLMDRHLSLSPPAMNLSLLSPPAPNPAPLLSLDALETNLSAEQEMPPPPIPHSRGERRGSLSAANLQLQSVPSIKLDPTLIVGGGTAGSDEDPRIKAYAKLEFPTFDMYIQKLSVIIGRRPAPVVVVASPILTGEVDGARESEALDAKPVEVKLEDFVVGLEDDLHAPLGEGLGLTVHAEEQAIKLEEPLVISPGKADELKLFVTPCSPTASAAVDEGPHSGDQTEVAVDLSEFLKSSSPTSPSMLDSKVILPPLPTSTSPIKVASPQLVAAVEKVSVSEPAPAVATPEPAAIMTDIDLGPIRAVSRQHARLYFDYELGSWAIEVLGRNGVVVEGKWKAKGEKEGLGKRTKIQIAERIFYFVLPTLDTPATSTTAVQPLVEAPMSDDDDEEEDDEDDSSSLSEMSDSDIELSPLMTAADASSPALHGSTSVLEDGPARAVPTISIGRARRTSTNQRTSYYGEEDMDFEPAVDEDDLPYDDDYERPPLATHNGSTGKNLKVIQAVRTGGKGGKAKAGKGKGKMEYSPSVSHGSGGAPVGKGKGKSKKLGKSLAQIKKAKKSSFNSSFYSDEEEEDELEDVYDDEEDDLVEEEFDGEDEMYEYAGGTAAGSTGDGDREFPVEPVVKPRGVIVPVPIKKEKRAKKVVAQKAPRVATVTAPAALPVLPPLPALPATFGSAAAVPAPPEGIAPNSIELKPVVDPYALPGHGSTSASPAPQASTGRASAAAVNQPPAFGPDGQPIKRGRGRPPKNGICAQRPRKPKPKPDPSTVPPKAGKAPVVKGVSPGKVSPYTLPFASTSSAGPSGPPSGSQTIPTYTAGVFPPGEQPLSAAPESDRMLKPPFTYASLIAQAVMKADNSKLTLNGIYDWITQNWPYFSDNQNGWQNSIRHNLTLSRGFLKIARRPDEPGKGAFWTLDYDQVANFDGFNFRKKNAKPPPDIKPAVPSMGPKMQPMQTARSINVGPSQLVRPNGAPGMQQRPGGQPQRPLQRPGVPGAPRPANATAPSLSTPLPIIISPIPATYVRPPPPVSATPPDELTAALLKDPPIVLHEGKLILNPGIFATLTKDQLKNLQLLPASQALSILQAFVVTHFKAKMKLASLQKAKAASDAASAAAGGAPRVPTGLKTNGSAPPGSKSASPHPTKAVPPVSARPVAVVPMPASRPAAAAETKKRKADESDSDIEIVSAKSAKVEAFGADPSAVTQ